MAAGSAAGTGVRAAGGYAERKLVTPAFEDAGSATMRGAARARSNGAWIGSPKAVRLTAPFLR